MKQSRTDREPERRPVALEPERSPAPRNERHPSEARDPGPHYRATNRSGGTRDPKSPPEWGEDLVY
ncbi:MAG: hypothetical protein EOO11_07055 [Chitinophagaceae bacterium]|nr:MAG: hypothetical protein EOO11_07055 [Chitinophagaceae bacterium]